MAMRSVLSGLSNEGEWILGATNFDEDLHFSSYYLRASMASRSVLGGVPGYTALVAHYSDFTERYYLLRDECLSVAAALLSKAVKDPSWLPQVLSEIEVRSADLERVFDDGLSSFDPISDDVGRLLDLYRDHHDRHERLYEVARIPEALDRGVEYFSRHLRLLLRDRRVLLTEPGS